MSSENDEQPKKLFEFDSPDVGLRSVNLLNNFNVTIPTSKWEITPRTATQSKRLKWDQTPFGVVKIESEIYKDNKLRSASGFTYKQQENDFMFNKRLTLDEINTILPKNGYSIFNVWNNEDIEQIDFQLFDEEEKLFFSEFNETIDEDIKDVYKGLYILKKIKKNKSKRVLKIFTKCKNKKFALEKVILFCFCFNLSIKEKSLLLKIINILLNDSISIFRREIFYIIAKFSEVEELENECKELFMITFKNKFEDYKIILEREIRECEKETKDLISKLLVMGIYIFGIKKHLVWFREFCVYGKSKEKTIILYSLILVVKKLSNSLRLFRNELLDFIEIVVRDSQNHIKTISGHLINLMFEKSILDKTTETFNRLLKMMSNNKLTYEDVMNVHLPQEKWVIIWIKALSYVSQDSEQYSKVVFSLLRKCKQVDHSVFKILNNLEVDLNDIEQFAKDNLEACFLTDNKKSLIMFLKRYGCSEMIKNELTLFILDSERADLVLEIISESNKLEYLDDAFNENLYIALKNTTITNRKPLKWVFRNTQNIDKFRDLFLSLCNREDKKLFGFIYLTEIVEFLDTNTLSYIGNIFWERLENLEGNKLYECLNLLNKIYRRKKYQSLGEIIYLCSSKLKGGDKKVKKMIFKFLTNVINNNMIEAMRFNKTELIRLCYEASNSLTLAGEKTRRIIVEFVRVLGRFVNLQDLIDVFLYKLYESDNYKGIIGALVSISKQYGLFYLLPKLMIKYESSPSSIRLQISKLILEFIESQKLLEEKYLATVILIIEDLILDKELEMRRSALKLISALIKTFKPPNTNLDIVIHLLNIGWFCVLDEIEFEECWNEFTTTLNHELLINYLLQGLYHPNKKIRTRYETLYNKLQVINKKI